MSIIASRVAPLASRAGVPSGFFLDDLGYSRLAPILRLAINGGVCLPCGHPFRGDDDAQLDHNEPPRHPRDWARLHVRNVSIKCKTCNGSKGSKPYTVYLDEAEEARLSANAWQQSREARIAAPEGLRFDSAPGRQAWLQLDL